MNDIQQQAKQAFAHWLRTGWLPPARSADGVELKFNPYHDPHDGRFTFAPWRGGVAPREAYTRFAGPRAGPPMARGGNARAMDRAMTLEQSFPTLRNAPGSSIIAVADGFFGITGPANEMKVELLNLWRRQVIEDIRALNPSYVDNRSRPGTTLKGMESDLNFLRFERAAAYLRFKNDPRPLQVETFRFVQERANIAYEEGLSLLKAGRLPIRLSESEALGNYIDRSVREQLRLRFSWMSLNLAQNGPVRANANEYITSGGDLTYRRPDARVGNIAFDVTLTAKNQKTAQVIGFFNTDFRPSHVIIIRPRQLGNGASYILTRPE